MTTTDHGRSRYRRGCRCDVCRQANREYQRGHRAKQLQAVPVPEPDFTDAATPVVDAVQAEIDASSIAGQRPGLAAIALAMARILDNPHAIPIADGRRREVGGAVGQAVQGRSAARQAGRGAEDDARSGPGAIIAARSKNLAKAGCSPICGIASVYEANSSGAV